MKQCPDCAAQYEDNASFCPKDGRALVTKTTMSTRLCPHCANSIAADATQCPYCKGDLDPTPAPQWPTREEPSLEVRSPRAGNKISTGSLVVLILALLFFGAGLFLFLEPAQRVETPPVASQESAKEIQERDQKIQSLDSELNRVRQELTSRSEQVKELQTKLDETQKDLTTMQQRLAIANREVERAVSNRPPPSAAPPRPADRLPPPPPPPPRRAAAPGTYETVRATSVYEEPSGSARVLSKIPKGTRVEVVRSTGDWLEVRSKHGNPPGFVRLDDAMFMSPSN
ncbi:MAG: SH3 domain-containing protein [Alphaproteobacteria bacterium]